MKRFIYTLTLLLFLGVSQGVAQNPYKAQGIHVEPLTLSKGKYNEFFTNDTLVQIGSVLFNTNTNKVVKYLEPDSSGIPMPEPGTSSRFLSIDPLAAKYPSISPYSYALSNPISFIDPDGRAAVRSGCEPYCFTAQETRRKLLSGETTPQQNANQVLKEGGGLVAALSVFVPGPEDAVIGVVAASKAWKAVKGVFKSGDEVAEVSSDGARLFQKHFDNIEGIIADADRIGADNKIPGGLAGAIRHTKETGEFVGGSSHIEKGRNTIRALNKKLKAVKNSHSLSDNQRNQLINRVQSKIDEIQGALDFEN